MRKTIFAEGEYYHLYNRGVDKRVVFTDKQEYERFLAYLYYMNDAERTRLTDDLRLTLEAKPREKGWKPLVAIGAYCLMPNHFHLYATPCVEGGISKFMQRVQTAYTMYFNERHARSGALFQGTFKSQHVERENYAKYLFSYIHLNPAKLKDVKWKERKARDMKRLENFVAEYPYSSMGEYLRRDFKITNPEAFPEYFRTRSDFSAHITDWLSYAPFSRLNLEKGARGVHAASTTPQGS